MKQVNLHETKTPFSRLIERASEGEEILIARAGMPLTWLVPFSESTAARRKGSLKGKLQSGGDFDAPLPEDVLAAFDDAPVTVA